MLKGFVQGNICGRGVFSNHPMLLMFDMTQCLNPAVVVEGCLTPKVIMTMIMKLSMMTTLLLLWKTLSHQKWKRSKFDNSIFWHWDNKSENNSRCASTDVLMRATPLCSTQRREPPRRRSRGRWKTSAGWTRWRSSTGSASRSLSKKESVRHGKLFLKHYKRRWQLDFWLLRYLESSNFLGYCLPINMHKENQTKKVFW